MALVPLSIPPGVYRNGTDLQSAGRWRDASLVRWTDGTMQPVGGWQARVTVAADKVMRGAIAWTDNNNDKRFACGSYEKLYAISAGGTVTDITPSGLVAGTVDASQNLGYGGGFYGTGLYGVARPDIGNYSPATTWALDVWGQFLVACSSKDGKIYEWQLNTANDAALITNAPTSNRSIVVTEERFLFALGAGGNPRKVQWSDREDNTTWTPAITNQAGSLTLPGTGVLMQGLRMRGQTLILSDEDAHLATYQGGEFVYGFERVGTACGVVSQLAAVSLDTSAYWMGTSGFFRYAGAVEPLVCDVADYVFTNMNTVQRSKVFAVTNAKHNEIWWFYPSSSSTEIDSYVTFNVKEGHWSIGQLARTAGFDRGTFANPIYFAADGKAYDHEISSTLATAPFAESGPISIGNGDQVMCVTSLIPDEKTQGQVTATFKTRFHPNDVERSYGPYSMANPISVRFTGRQVRMRVTGAANESWRVGIMRVEAVPGGRR